jgi:hypothetical protein
MPKSKNVAAKPSETKGNFAEQRNGLLSLFSDSDGQGKRSWREVFGYERRSVAKEGEPFIARAKPKSSSGS